MSLYQSSGALKKISEHSFNGKNNLNYKVDFERQRFIASYLVCRLYKENIRIRCFAVYFENEEEKTGKEGFLYAFADGMIGEVIFEAVVGMILFIMSHLALDYIVEYLETSTKFSDILGAILLLLLIYIITGRREYPVRED